MYMYMPVMVEQPKATLMSMDAEQVSELQRKWAHIPEVARLRALVKLKIPDGTGSECEVRYADDLYSFLHRSDDNIRMFFFLCDLCGLGSGTVNNREKTMLQLIGSDRERTHWPLIQELGVKWIKEGHAMEVTGLLCGYGRSKLNLVLRAA